MEKPNFGIDPDHPYKIGGQDGDFIEEGEGSFGFVGGTSSPVNMGLYGQIGMGIVFAVITATSESAARASFKNWMAKQGQQALWFRAWAYQSLPSPPPIRIS